MTTIVHLVHEGWGNLRVGYASAISIVFFLIVLGVSVLQRRFLPTER
jgi:multiple sugar transport system permease protein